MSIGFICFDDYFLICTKVFGLLNHGICTESMVNVLKKRIGFDSLMTQSDEKKRDRIGISTLTSADAELSELIHIVFPIKIG